MRRQKAKRAPQYEAESYRALQRCLGQRVLALRNERGWTQAEAAHRCGMSTWQYQRVETELTNVTFTTLARLMDGFKVSVLELVHHPESRTTE